MDKTTPRKLELMTFLGSVVLPGLLLLYSWYVLSPTAIDTGGLIPKTSLEVPDTTAADSRYVGAHKNLWPEGEDMPWVVAEPEEEMPPVDLVTPAPSIPEPPTPLPNPGPRLEHTSKLPRWGSFPGSVDAAGDDGEM